MTATALHAQTSAHFSRKRMRALAVPLIVLAYFVYIFFAFDVAGLGDRINVNNARTLVADAYSYKTHVTQDNRDGAFSVAIEGERRLALYRLVFDRAHIVYAGGLEVVAS